MSPLVLLQQGKTKRRGFLLFLAADFAVFLTLLAIYFYFRTSARTWPKAFHFPSGLMGFGMAMFAIAASLTMLVALYFRNRQEDSEAARMVAVSFACWFSFAFIQVIEWARLIYVEKVTLLGNPWDVPQYGAVYFLLTGFQFLHVVLGGVYLLFVARRIRAFDLPTAAAFVHYANLLFLILLPLVVLSSTDLQGL